MVRRHGRRYRIEEKEPEPMWLQGLKELRKTIEATARMADSQRTIPTNYDIGDRARGKQSGEMTLEEAAEVLGIEPDSNLQVAKDAYHKLAKEFHPDTNKSPDAHKKFIKVRTAYDVFKQEWS
jgi:DnaJ-domain-containing protein 1